MNFNHIKTGQARLIGAFTTLGFLSACAAATPFVAPVGGNSPNPGAPSGAAASATVGGATNVGGTNGATVNATGAGTGVGAGAGATAGVGAGINAGVGVNGNASLGGTSAGVTALAESRAMRDQLWSGVQLRPDPR